MHGYSNHSHAVVIPIIPTEDMHYYKRRFLIFAPLLLPGYIKVQFISWCTLITFVAHYKPENVHIIMYSITHVFFVRIVITSSWDTYNLYPLPLLDLDNNAFHALLYYNKKRKIRRKKTIGQLQNICIQPTHYYHMLIYVLLGKRRFECIYVTIIRV